MTRKLIAICALIAALLAVLVKQSYQQAPSPSPPPPPSAEVTSCMEQTPASTLRTFWTEANKNCASDPYKLLDLYESGALSGASDKCARLLQHQLRKSLVATSATIFEEALIARSFAANTEVNRLAFRLARLDQRILAAIWERTIEAVYFFISGHELLEALAQCDHVPTKIIAVLRLQWKQMQPSVDTSLLMQLVQFWSELRKTVPQPLQQQVASAYNALPEQVRLLYGNNNYNDNDDGEKQRLRLLNVAHWEYLYAPRQNGPDPERRTPLTWIMQKNTTDSDGDFVVVVRADGDVAIGSRYGALNKFLYADEEHGKPYFWLGASAKESRWWRAQWHGDYYTLKNALTEGLLCATGVYDENRRYATLKRDDGTGDISTCRWAVVKATPSS